MISLGERWTLRSVWVIREPRPTSLWPTRRFAHSPFRLFAPLQRGLEGMPTECCAFQALRKFLYPGEST
jgi:hypothetical protein